MNQNKHFTLKLIWDYEGLYQTQMQIRILKEKREETRNTTFVAATEFNERRR